MTDYSKWDKFDAVEAEKVLKSQEYTNDLLRGNKEVEAVQCLLQKNVVSSAALIKSKELVTNLKEIVPLNKRKHHRFNLSYNNDVSRIAITNESSVDFISNCMNNISDMISNITRNVEKLRGYQDGIVTDCDEGYISGYNFGIEITKDLSRLINYAKVLTTAPQQDINYVAKLVEDIYNVANYLLRQTVVCTSICALFIGKFAFVAECNSFYIIKSVSDESTYINILLLGCSLIGIGNTTLAIKYLDFFNKKCPQYSGILECLEYLKELQIRYNENNHKKVFDGSIYLYNILRHLDKSQWNRLGRMSIKLLSKEMIDILLQSQLVTEKYVSIEDYIDKCKPTSTHIVESATSLFYEGKILFIEKMYRSASIKYTSALLLLDKVANDPIIQMDTRVKYLKCVCLVNTALCKVQIKPLEDLCLMRDEYETQLRTSNVQEMSYLNFLTSSSPLILVKEAASTIESFALKIKELQILEKMYDFDTEILELEILINRIQSNNDIILKDPFINNRGSSFSNEFMTINMTIPLIFSTNMTEIETEINFSGELLSMLKHCQFLEKKYG